MFVTVSVSVSLLNVKLESPLNADPPSLNCTCLSDPPTTPDAPTVEVIVIEPFDSEVILTFEPALI